MPRRETFEPTPAADDDVDDAAGDVDLTGRHVLITDGGSPIGDGAAQVLAERGADVTVATRDDRTGARRAARIRELTGNRLVRAVCVDLADRDSIGRFVASWWSPLDILINTADVAPPRRLIRTTDGWEHQFASKPLARFDLAVGLFEHFTAAAQGARIVSVSSNRHLFSPVVFDDIDYRFRPYDPVTAQGQAETATILLSVAASDQWASAGIVANAVGTAEPWPERPAEPNPQRDQPADTPARTADHDRGSSGLATVIRTAVSPLLDGVGGRYFENGAQARAVDHRTADLTGVASYALDPDNAERLWAHLARRM